MKNMADTLHAMRAPSWLWDGFAAVVGEKGRTADLKVFMDWAIDNPRVLLADDVSGPHDQMITFRIEDPRWDLFLEALDKQDYASAIRRYINWRIQNPDQPLPGRRLGPLKRSPRRPLACV